MSSKSYPTPEKLYRATVTKTVETEVLVAANDPRSAEREILNSDIKEEFRNLFDEDADFDVSCINEVDITPKVEKEIKDYGIYGMDYLAIYDFMEHMRELKSKRAKEEYLKKHHMEFNFG